MPKGGAIKASDTNAGVSGAAVRLKNGGTRVTAVRTGTDRTLARKTGTWGRGSCLKRYNGVFSAA